MNKKLYNVHLRTIKTLANYDLYSGAWERMCCPWLDGINMSIGNSHLMGEL